MTEAKTAAFYRDRASPNQNPEPGLHRRRLAAGRLGQGLRERQPGDRRDLRHRGRLRCRRCRSSRSRRRGASSTPAPGRARRPKRARQVLLRLADLVRANTEELAVIESIDSGKTIKDCLHEIGNEVPTFFQWYAELIDKSFGKVAPTAEATRRADRQGADRRRRPGPAVELPAAHGRLEAGAGACRRLLGRAEAGRADAAHRAAPRRARDRGRAAGRGPQRRPRLRRDRRPGDRPAHGHRRRLLHRLDRGRRLFPEIFEREQSQAGRPGDGRQEPVHRPRRCADRRRPDQFRRHLGLLERRPELLGQHAPDRRPQGAATPSSTGCSPGSRRSRLGDPLDPATELGSMVSAEHQARVLGYIDRGKQEGARVAHDGGQVAGPRGLLCQPDRVRRGQAGHGDRARGDLRPGARPDHRLRPRRSASPSPATRNTACTPRSSPATSARPSRWRGRFPAARSRSTPSPRAT